MAFVILECASNSSKRGFFKSVINLDKIDSMYEDTEENLTVMNFDETCVKTKSSIEEILEMSFELK